MALTAIERNKREIAKRLSKKQDEPVWVVMRFLDNLHITARWLDGVPFEDLAREFKLPRLMIKEIVEAWLPKILAEGSSWEPPYRRTK